jgi:hypothetical protein
MKIKMSFTIPASDHRRVRSGVRPERVIVDQKTRERLPRKAKHKKRTDW